MFTKPVIVTAIDVGTNKVCALLGRQGRGGQGEILGAGVVPSKGVSQDTVTNIPALADAMASAVSQASRAAGVAPSSAIIGISGPHLKTLACTGSLRKDDSGLPLSPEDLENALVAARPPHLPIEQQLLHLVAREYLLDGVRGIRNPVGMHALHLEVSALAILAGSAQVENMMKAAARANLSVSGLVFQALAVGEAVLSREERDMGALVVDIGAGTTYLAFYWRGVLWDSYVIPIGGHHLTNDIAVVLGAPPQSAEEVKHTWGSAQPWKISSAEMVHLPGFHGGAPQEVSRKHLSSILHDRAVELLEFVQQKVKELPMGRLPAAGVVLTGGTASLPGLREVAKDVLGGQIRIGTPLPLNGAEALASPAFASSVGTLLWGLRYGARQPQPRNGRSEVAAPKTAVLHPVGPA